MSTPLADKTTISSRNKLAQLVGEHRAFTTSKLKSTIPTSSQVVRNSVFKTPATRVVPPASRISNLGHNGIPTSTTRESRLHQNAARQNNNNNSTNPIQSVATTNGGNSLTATAIKPPSSANSTSRFSHMASRVIPATTKIDRKSNAISSGLSSARQTSIGNSRLTGGTIGSRSPSVLSSVSSTHTLRQTSNHKDARPAVSNQPPDTNAIRKGLAKFSNPMECQRQFHALNQKLSEMNETLRARDHQVSELQEQLKSTVNRGLCYALTVQYFSKMLKLDCSVDLPSECKQLKSRIANLEDKENGYKQQLDTIVSDYQSHIKVEQDLRANIQEELTETRLQHAKVLEDLSNAHRYELNDLTDKNSAIQEELSDKIATLESELDSKCKELSELRSNHEALTTSFNKLEESLTKDKDARVKYAQEKVNQLQKDVDSLNSVLEMRSERMHALERDSILLSETQAELAKQKEISKSLGQQLESLEAALEKRKEQYELLIAEHEKIRQELRHERLDRRKTFGLNT